MINTVTIVGNLVREVELKYLPTGTALGTFSVAVNKYGKDASGNTTQKVSYIDCKAWGRSAEFLSQYAQKGNKIVVHGELEQETWTAKDGGKRNRIVINAKDVELMQAKQGGQAGGQVGGQAHNQGGQAAQQQQYRQPPAQPAPPPQQPQMDAGEEDIPF